MSSFLVEYAEDIMPSSALWKRELELLVESSPSRNPIAMVTEFFARRDAEVYFREEKGGTPQNPQFTTIAVPKLPGFVEFRTSATAALRHLSKRLAARALINLIANAELLTEEEAWADNPVGDLQEFCARTDLPHPEYTVSEGGVKHRPIFTVAVRVGLLSNTGTASNKKLAKRRAAEEMLDSLQVKY